MGRDDRRYLRQLRMALHGTGNRKCQVLEQMKDSVRDFAQENPTHSYLDLTNRFGSPQQIAGVVVDEMGTEEVLDAMKVRLRILRMVSITAVTALIIWASVVGMAYLKHRSIDNGYAVVEIVEVTEKTE